MEHTGIYNNHLLNFFQHKQANLWLEHPIHIKESLGMIRGKNDKVDAHRIALYAYKNRDEVRLWVPKREVIQKLDRLTATRSRLVKVRKMLQSPLTDSEGFISKKDHTAQKKACQKTLNALAQDIKQVQAEITATIEHDGSGQPSLLERTVWVCAISQGYWPRYRHRTVNCDQRI